MFLYDVKVPWGVETLSPHRHNFVTPLLPQLSILVQDSGKGGASAITSHSYHSPVTTSTSYISSLTSTALPLVECSSTVSSIPDNILENGSSDAGDSDSIVNTELSRLSQPKKNQEFSNAMDIGGQETPGEVKVHLEANPQAVGFVPGESEERKAALRIMNTICKWLTCHVSKSYYSIPPELYQLLPHLCQLESIDTDQELRRKCMTTLAYISQAFILPENIDAMITTVSDICHTGWWRARTSVLGVLQVIMFLIIRYKYL